MRIPHLSQPVVVACMQSVEAPFPVHIHQSSLGLPFYVSAARRRPASIVGPPQTDNCREASSTHLDVDHFPSFQADRYMAMRARCQRNQP